MKKLRIFFQVIYDNRLYLKISKKIVNKVLSNMDLIASGENIVHVSRTKVYCLHGETIKFLKNPNFDKKYRIKYVLSNMYTYTREEYLLKNAHIDNNYLNNLSFLLR